MYAVNEILIPALTDPDFLAGLNKNGIRDESLIGSRHRRDECGILPIFLLGVVILGVFYLVCLYGLTNGVFGGLESRV